MICSIFILSWTSTCFKKKNMICCKLRTEYLIENFKSMSLWLFTTYRWLGFVILQFRPTELVTGPVYWRLQLEYFQSFLRNRREDWVTELEGDSSEKCSGIVNRKHYLGRLESRRSRVRLTDMSWVNLSYSVNFTLTKSQIFGSLKRRPFYLSGFIPNTVFVITMKAFLESPNFF